MKHVYKIWLLLLTVCYAWTLQAAPVDSLTVSKVATAYLSQYVDRFEGLECVVKRTSTDGTALYYIFNHKNNKGFIIVTADDACFPILGYATTGNFAPDNIPPQLDKMLFHRAAEIRFIKREKFTANDEIKQQWQELKYPPAAARLGQALAVGPLLTTTWNQSPYYNDLCPADAKAPQADGYKVVSGCVATAMAQIMKYHNFPKTGQGVYSYTHSKYGRLSADFSGTTYNWTSMPNRVTSRNTAVATLMYHCGVSVNMDYDISTSGGSSAATADVAEALKKYFGYASSAKYVKREGMSEAAWTALLKIELDAKRPIQYRGSGSEGGHSFVCDGYSNDNTFHFNWGWDSQSDGYFNINALNPGSLGTGGGAGGFNSGQGAVIGIQPAVATSSSFDLQLNKKITVNPTSIDFGDDLTVSFNITNQGNAPFQGDYAVAIFTNTGDFINFIDQPKTNFSLPAGNKYVSDLTFTQKSLFLSEGNYLIAAYYREPQKEWQLLGKATFANPLQVAVNGVNDNLKMYKTPLQTSTSPIYQKTPFTVSCNIANFGTTTFEGDLRMTLYNLDGSYVSNIEIKNGLSLTPNTYYSSTLEFKTSGLDVPTGTYLVALTYKRKTETSYSILAAYKDSNGTYPNLIQVVVAAVPLVADRFEPNEKEAQAFSLPMSFVNNVASITTEGSNLHVGSDIDYYKLNVASGYTYEVKARVHDSDNSGNGKTYTSDIIFSYKVGSGAYSDVYDVSINDSNDKINLKDANTVIFKLAPYFVGEKGTYLLDIQVIRKQIVLGVEDEGLNEQLVVYPNPTTGPITVQTPNPVRLHAINVMNVMGQKVMELDYKQVTDKINLDLSRYPAGMYYLQLTNDTQSITRKVSLIK